jgi:hypothetical protein
VVDDCGNIISFSITSGNTDDRVPVPSLLKQVTGAAIQGSLEPESGEA